MDGLKVKELINYQNILNIYEKEICKNVKHKNKLKVFRYFCNKGFSYEKVRVAYEIYMDEFTQF